MRCFYNAQHEAVGVCRLCLRGVCAACSSDLAAGLACKDRCETGVTDTEGVIKYNSALVKRYQLGAKQQMLNRKTSMKFCFILAGLLGVGGIACWFLPDLAEMAAVSFGLATMFFFWARSHRKALELETALAHKG